MGQAQLNAMWMLDTVFGQPEDLPILRDVERVSPKVIRILGQNPGQLTLQGTNTYLVGDGPERLLIDTSDGNSHWWPLVQQVLKDESAEITQVVITHGHHDHVGGLDDVRAAFPKAEIRKWLPCASSEDSCEQFVPNSLTKAFGSVKRRTCGCDGQVPADCLSLAEDAVLDIGDCQLRVLLTPGHSGDSLCLVLGTEATTEAILTGDSVLGGRTARFGDLPAYNASLRRLLRIVERSDGVLLLPGHGDVVVAADSTEYLKSILRMQTNREKAVLRMLKVSPGTAGDLCSAIYGSSAAALMAQDLIEQHLEDLQAKGRAKSSEGFLGRTWWEPVTLLPMEA
mmetsp:Transcript_39081/g.72815  ORF Transcript_39081/g.72815 Transcript_39081/m.72815 type:complete len:340 (+) Transcript_39081:64-1083(+)